MYKGAERIPTAEIFVKELQDKNIPFLFVTNNATKTATEVKENLLHNFQIDVTEDHIYTSAMAALISVRLYLYPGASTSACGARP